MIDSKQGKPAIELRQRNSKRDDMELKLENMFALLHVVW